MVDGDKIRKMSDEEESDFITDNNKCEFKAKDTHPKCYIPNDDPYPLCKGANTPQGIAENDCYDCCLYEDWRPNND